jgi:hypothetical protein
VDLLRRLQDAFEQVILITHIESVRDGLDRVVSVRYDEERGSRASTRSRRAASRSTCTSERRTDGTSRVWRPAGDRRADFVRGSSRVTELNQVFSDSFTERYRRDGMVGVRVPFLNPAIWRYAIEDADARRDALARRSRAHRRVQHGCIVRAARGWMGPLAVRTEYQGALASARRS